MMKVDRVRVHRRGQVQALQDQLPHPRVAVSTGPLLIGAGVRDGAGIGMEDSSRVLVPVVLVVLDFAHSLRGTIPNEEIVIDII